MSKKVIADIQDNSSDFSIAKWLTVEDFVANICVLIGGKRPETREELNVFMESVEGKDAKEAHEEFETLSLAQPFKFSQLKLRMGLELIKNNASKLRLLPGKNADLMKAWARACAAYVRYSRAAEATDRISLDDIDFDGIRGQIVKIYNEAETTASDPTNHTIIEEKFKLLMNDDNRNRLLAETLATQIIPSGMRVGRGTRTFFRVIEEPSEGWVTRKDAETLMDLSKIEQVALAGDWIKTQADITSYLKTFCRDAISGNVYDIVDIVVANHLAHLKAKMKGRLRTQVPAYAIALSK